MSKFHRLVKLFCTFLLSFYLALLLPSSTQAISHDENTSYFSNFEADYYLTKDQDGSAMLRIVENLTAVFPKNSSEHGIIRYLPFTGQEDLADGKTLAINVMCNGQPENIASIGALPHEFDVRIGHPDRIVSGTQIYQLEYTYRNVIQPGQAFQKLYWNTNGVNWDKSFDRLTARLHIDSEILPNLINSSCYTGRYGENDQARCEIKSLTDGVEFSAKDLNANENLTFDLTFLPDTFAVKDQGYTLDTKTYTDYRLIILTIIVICLAIALLIVAAFAWRSIREKRQFYEATFIVPEYTPPAGFSVAEMAKNYLGITHGDKRVAVLLDLAVHHKVELIKDRPKKWKIRLKTLDLTKQEAAVLKILTGRDQALTENQEIVIKAHNSNSAITKLSKEFSDSITSKLRTTGLFEPLTSKFQFSTIIYILGIIWIFGWLVALVFVFDEKPDYVIFPYAELCVILLTIILITTAAVLFITASKVSQYEKHTKKGLQYSRYLDGLKLYIKMAEADRLKVLQSVNGAEITNAGIVKLYEKLLPYALIFGLETSWLKELGRYYAMSDVSEPTWYVGLGVFSARDFSSAIIDFSTTASNTVISSSTSSSSGNSGGGFSGGGGGGGGGSTW